MSTMSKAEIAANEAVTFHPMTDRGQDSKPMVTVAGVQVYAYVADGKLRVSIDLDTAGEWFPDADRGVPMKVCVGDATIFDTDEQGRITFGETRERRRFGGTPSRERLNDALELNPGISVPRALEVAELATIMDEDDAATGYLEPDEDPEYGWCWCCNNFQLSTPAVSTAGLCRPCGSRSPSACANAHAKEARSKTG